MEKNTSGELSLFSIADAARIAGCAADIFPQRAARAATFRRPEDRLRSIAAGALLFLSDIPEEEILYTGAGKPYAPGRRHFSLSHSGEYAALAVCDVPVGADLEQLAGNRRGAILRAMTEEEKQHLAGAPDAAFFTLWTFKEGLSKAIGAGLSLGFSSFSALPMTEERPVTVGGKTFFGRIFSLPGYALAAVSEGKPCEFSLRILTAGDVFKKLSGKNILHKK